MDIYFASIIARNYRLFIILCVFVIAGAFTCAICQDASRPHTPNSIGENPTMSVNYRLDGFDVYGGEKLLYPLTEQLQRMNKIEAMENHAQWPEMSDNPEDYLR